MCSGSEAGSYLRLIDLLERPLIAQHPAQPPIPEHRPLLVAGLAVALMPLFRENLEDPREVAAPVVSLFPLPPCRLALRLLLRVSLEIYSGVI